MKKLITGLLFAALLGPSPGSAQVVDDNPPDTLRGLPGDSTMLKLNPDDPTFNLWKMVRDRSADPNREPGPIHIQRYEGGAFPSGIPTFFNLPVALNAADLEAGDVDVAIMGAGVDMGTGMRGASWGPRMFRVSDMYGTWGGFTMEHMHTMVDPFRELTMVDYGDAGIDMLSAIRSATEVRRLVREIAEAGAIPIIIGGDHSLTYPDVAGVTDAHGKEQVAVVHFDAHYDGTPGTFGHPLTHGTWVWNLMDEGHVRGNQYIQVGLRGYYPDAASFEKMRNYGFRYHTMAEVEARGWTAVMQDVLAEAEEIADKIFISFDIDVIDPAYTKGTGTPEPGGVTPREILPLIRGLCNHRGMVGMDLVEYLPLADPSYVTGQVSNRVVRECLVGIAMRKKGIDDPFYLSPLTVEHSEPKVGGNGN